MQETSDAPIASLVRTEGAPPTVPATVNFSTKSSSISVGRLDSNAVVLNDRKISKVHARLTLRTCKRKRMADGEIMKRLFVKDSSTFGTFVNGKRVPAKLKKFRIRSGDTLQIKDPGDRKSVV